MLSKTHTKYIQTLQHKKARDEHAVFLAEGPKVTWELLNSGKFICKEIFATAVWLAENNKRLSLVQNIPVTEVKDFELQKISALATPNAVVAVFEKRKPENNFPTGLKITLALDTIQDPGNLGTIIRIADWFGIENIVCSFGCADMYNAKVVQSTMGSLARVNIVYVDLQRWVSENKKVKIYAASLDGRDVKAVGKLKEGILVIGNEANGINDSILQLVDEKITIGKIGEAESLNAAVATGIILSYLK